MGMMLCFILPDLVRFEKEFTAVDHSFFQMTTNLFAVNASGNDI